MKAAQCQLQLQMNDMPFYVAAQKRNRRNPMFTLARKRTLGNQRTAPPTAA